mgnify:CR=1 FL=1
MEGFYDLIAILAGIVQTVLYCDFFYLFTTDEKVAKLEEIPENWGWMTERGGKIFILKKAPKLKAEPIPKKLMINMESDIKELIYFMVNLELGNLHYH